MKRKQWVRSEEALSILGSTSCELMHLREAGLLRFEKVGNAYNYSRADIEREAIRRQKNRRELS